MSLLPWLEPTWQELLKRQKTGLPHALLITGLQGIGKNALSQHIAQWLLCKTARTQNLSTACGQCHSCNLWKAGSHPDYLQVVAEEGSRQIRVESIRKVNEFMVQTPQISHCQVVNIHPIEIMNTNAANALLKTLEEPAGESYLLLETERFGSVLPTIRSRCQRISLAPPSLQQALNWLQQQGIAEVDQAEQALRLHQGAPLAALAWLQNDHNQQQQWLQQLQQWSHNQIALTELASEWSKLELVDLTRWFYTVLLDCMKQQMGVPAEQQGLQGEVQKVLAGTGVDKLKLIALQNKVQQILGQLLSGMGNQNKQLMLESMLIDWQALFIKTT